MWPKTFWCSASQRIWTSYAPEGEVEAGPQTQVRKAGDEAGHEAGRSGGACSCTEAARMILCLHYGDGRGHPHHFDHSLLREEEIA